MEKKIICILVSMLMCATVFTVTGTTNETYDANFEIVENSNSKEPLAIWDIQFNLDGSTPTGEVSIVGAEFDGTHFLVTEWGYTGAIQPRIVSKLSKTGSLVSQWTPTWLVGGSGGLRDLAYDGEYFYGGNSGSTIYQFTVDGTLINSWPVISGGTIRSIAYDEDYDAFWINNFATNLELVDRSGNTLYTITSPTSMYGSAWEKDSEGTPVLWVFTGTSTGGPCQIAKYTNIYAGGTSQGTQHSVSGDFGATGIAGGLFYTDLYEPGYGTLGGMMQYEPDTLFGYELCQTNSPPDTPGAPSGPTQGNQGVSYTFTASTTDPEGDPIEYWFEWGDGNNSGWVSPGSASHAWATEGIFNVTVKARDDHGGQSAFSPAHQIEILGGPILDIKVIRGGIGKIKVNIENMGGENATGVAYTISLVGGAFIGKESNGTVDIPVGQTKEVTSKFIFGLGKTVVTVTATHPQSTDTRTQNGNILFFFIKVKPGG